MGWSVVVFEEDGWAKAASVESCQRASRVEDT